MMRYFETGDDIETMDREKSLRSTGLRRKNMKTLGIAALMVFLIAVSPAQEVMGIKIQGRIIDVVAQFEQKGFVQKVSKKDVIYMQGTVENRNMELWLACTPKTRLVWKAQVAFKGKSAWNELKTQFDDMRDALIQKYGEPTHDFRLFSSPYCEGDGNETFAVSSDKVHFASSWIFDDYSIRLEISTYQHVTMSCKNTANRAIDCSEQQEISRASLLLSKASL